MDTLDTGLARVFRRYDNENNPNTIIPFRSVTALPRPGGGWLTSPYMASITTIVSRPFPFPAEYFKFYFQHSTLTWSQSRSSRNFLQLPSFAPAAVSNCSVVDTVSKADLRMSVFDNSSVLRSSSHLLEMLDNDAATYLTSGIST